MKLTVYGSFNCPYSYLASLRAGRLTAAGAAGLKWRAVVHDPTVPPVWAAGHRGARADTRLARWRNPSAPERRIASGPMTAGMTWLGSASQSRRQRRIRRYPVAVSGPPSVAIVPPDRRTMRARSGSRSSRLGMSGLASLSRLFAGGHIRPVTRRRTS